MVDQDGDVGTSKESVDSIVAALRDDPGARSIVAAVVRELVDRHAQAQASLNIT